MKKIFIFLLFVLSFSSNINAQTDSRLYGTWFRHDVGFYFEKTFYENNTYEEHENYNNGSRQYWKGTYIVNNGNLFMFKTHIMRVGFNKNIDNVWQPMEDVTGQYPHTYSIVGNTLIIYFWGRTRHVYEKK